MDTTNNARQLEDFERDPDDERMFALLDRGWNQLETAQWLGCSTEIVESRMADPAFAAEVRRRRQATVSATTARLVQLGESATAELEALLTADDARVRLQASQIVLELGHRYHQDELMVGYRPGRATGAEEPLDGDDHVE